MLRSLQIIAVMIAAVFPICVFGQTVSSKDGNVFFKAKDGSTTQITSSGLDLDPSLSTDKKHVIFVRRTPLSKIDTGAGSLDTNELWVAETTKGGNAHRILAGLILPTDFGAIVASLSSTKQRAEARLVRLVVSCRIRQKPLCGA